MKFQATPAFGADWGRLTEAERSMFRSVVREDFHPACERRRVDAAAAWPKQLRVRSVAGAAGVWEMTWSFSGPDDRATFEWIDLDGDPAIRWRRIGGHEIFRKP